MYRYRKWSFFDDLGFFGFVFQKFCLYFFFAFQSAFALLITPSGSILLFAVSKFLSGFDGTVSKFH